MRIAWGILMAQAQNWTYEPREFDSTTVGAYTGSTIGQRYQMRLLIRDTNDLRPLFYDEELDWFQTQEDNVYAAAAAAAEQLVIQGGGVGTRKVGDLTVSYDVSIYRSLAGRLRARASSNQMPYCGGISIADKLAQRADADAVRPVFTVGIHDNPGAPKPDAESPSVNPLSTI